MKRTPEHLRHQCDRLRHALTDWRNLPVAYPILAEHGLMEATPNGWKALDQEVVVRRSKELIGVLEEAAVRLLYPHAAAHAAGETARLLADETARLVGRHPQMSGSNAAAVAAARIFERCNAEFDALRQAIKSGSDRSAGILVLEERYLAADAIGRTVQDLTGTRTLLADVGITDEALEAEYGAVGAPIPLWRSAAATLGPLNP